MTTRVEREAREAVQKRSHGMCERCGGFGSNIHHRRPRGMGGTSTPEDPTNLVMLCGSGTTGCHGWVESYRAKAWEQGWLVPRRDPREPTDVPVWALGEWCLLTAEGWVPFDAQIPF